ncbi:MAG TPA: hypothetical protein PKE29_15140 [Phycisphaerales bacterium]|nr:hypothetical protein [Phycisphaerales bacterium]
MIIVADSSPLILLAKTGDVRLLPLLFERVVVPPEVIAELGAAPALAPGRELASNPPDWLRVCSARGAAPIPRLQPGETAAICLALELGIGVILIDERRGRHAATARGLRVLGAIGVLELAAAMGVLDLAAAFERVKRTDFRISHDLLDARLRTFRDVRGRS